MPWYVPVAVRMVTGYVAVPILLKPLADRYAQAPLLLVRLAGCFALALALAAALGQASLDWTIVAVGGVNGLAAYCYRQAIAMSLSRTALFAFWDDLLAMGLSYGLLGEGQFLNRRTILGIVVSVSAVILFTVHSARKGQAGKDEENRISMRLYVYAGAYSIILGVGVFFMRYLGVQGVSLGTCLVNWYGGVVLAAAFLLLSAPAEERAGQAMLPRKDWLRVVGLSCSVLVTLSAAFWAYRMAPQTVVQPLSLVSEMVGPALVGLYVFAAREALDRLEQCYFVFGLGGGLLVALSFS